LRGTFFEKPNLRKILLSVLSSIVVISVVWGFFVIGSPNHFRNIRYDDQRVSDLQSIQWQLLDKYQTKGSLPNSLSELSDSLSGYSVPVDPETGESYEYKNPTVLATTTLTFELCADFSEKSQDLEGRGGYAETPSYSGKDIYYDPVFGNGKWEHNSGKTCFQRTIDPIKYPVNPKPLY
jgi:hypothetical protein